MFTIGFFGFLTFYFFLFFFPVCDKVSCGIYTLARKLCESSMKPDIIQDLEILQTDLFKIPGQRVIGSELFQANNVP